MTRTVSARTAALRSRLLKLLADANCPQSTPQLCALMTSGGRRCNTALTHRTYCHGPSQAPPCLGWCWRPAIYPQLRAMEKLGLVARVQYPNRASIEKAIAAGNILEHLREGDSRRVYWDVVADDSDAALNAVLDAAELHHKAAGQANG